MKKIFSLALLSCGLFISSVMFASAQYYSGYNYNSYNNYTPYYNNYANAPTSNSYTYTQGCYIYQYDAYTRQTSLIGSNCNTNSHYNTNYSYNTSPSYQTYYTQPTYSYSYTQPTYNYSSYVAPTTPYYTYQYNRQSGGWYPGGTNTYTSCYWYGGYQVCP